MRAFRDPSSSPLRGRPLRWLLLFATLVAHACERVAVRIDGLQGALLRAPRGQQDPHPQQSHRHRPPGPARAVGGRCGRGASESGLCGRKLDLFKMLFGGSDPLTQEIIEVLLADDRRYLTPSFTALVPGIAWETRSRDDPLYAVRGHLLGLELAGAMRDLGSNVGFWQAHLRGVFIRPLLGDDRLILHGELGYTRADTVRVAALGNSALNQMPEAYEFRTGGDRSARGYGYEKLLPKDSVTSGKHLVVGSIEHEKEIAPGWSAALFLGAGNAFNGFSAIDLKQGTGIGVRWRSPVGLVRLDFAVPLGESQDAFQIHFTIGPEF